MYRSHNCGEFNATHILKLHLLVGFKIQRQRIMNWIDLRDRYGITQLIFDEGRTENSLN
jgi:aspartyl-tRNA synthetase